LEAMAKSCPVVSSDRSSMPEILGSAAVYFDPENRRDMLEKIVRVISDDGLRKKLIAKGRKQARLYDWWESALKTLNIYKKVLYKNDRK
ncbi:glycosyltransferase, partial [Candidatus Falkowbacteria bacterium]|nr:glycosyltransferase [Candidatus Falkowbacteria bacterium]